MRNYVIFVGVGGVGKTTVVYRVVGVRAAPSPTKRPGIYHVNIKGSFYHILDVPGQYVEEVVEALSKMIFMFFDRDLFVHDLTRQDTLQALYDIADRLCRFQRCISAREIWVVGNKKDLAASLGVEYIPGLSQLGANKYIKISAIHDTFDKLLELLP